MTSPVTPQWSWVRVFDFSGVNGGVVHARGFESFTFGVNGGVVHGLGFEALSFVVNGGVVHGLGFETLSFGVNGGVVHGLLGFESLIFAGQWWCRQCRGFEYLSFFWSVLV
jgi:hypothetical protein